MNVYSLNRKRIVTRPLFKLAHSIARAIPARPVGVACQSAEGYKDPLLAFDGNSETFTSCPAVTNSQLRHIVVLH